ncbi:SH3 and multiple ankyrin repeat domains protein 2 [Arthrobotrys megalospora]
MSVRDTMMATISTTGTRLPHDAYTIGLLYVTTLEMNAMLPMIDEFHEYIPPQELDQNSYYLGKVGRHNVIVVGPIKQGKLGLADVVSRIRFSFRNVTMGLLVGIGGGVPQPGHDVRLGDIVVAAPDHNGAAIVQYDIGTRELADIRATTRLRAPPATLLDVVRSIRNRREGTDGFLTTHLQRFESHSNMVGIFRRPSHPDRLFVPTYLHTPGTDCGSHSNQHLAARPNHGSRQGKPCVHYGTILSGDFVVKNGIERDEISTRYPDAICFEMEAAGVMDVFPCLVVRGICDYCDSHKNDNWQPYAAAAAAAYAREVLLTL